MKKIIEFLESNKAKLIIYIICSACVALIGTGTVFLLNEAKVNKEITKAFKTDTNSGVIVVHVKGAVENSGVYELSAGSRIFDAIEAAGGFSADADREKLNLAEILEDGQQITVFSESDKQAQSELVNINTATLMEIMTLPGIGESYAEKIIEYRETHGSFQKKSDIKKVEGIGQKKYEAIKDFITV